MTRFKLTSEDKHFIKAVLSPSWLSGLLIVLAGLFVTVGSIITFRLNHSTFKQYLLSWEQSHTNAVVNTTSKSTQSVHPTIQNSWPLFILWALVGLLTYVIAASVIRFILETIKFRRELNYAHANPQSMLISAIEHIVTRLLAAALLGFLISSFIYRILPYAINNTHLSASHIVSLSGAKYALISFVTIMLSAYVGSVLLRLAVGKARLFSTY